MKRHLRKNLKRTAIALSRASLGTAIALCLASPSAALAESPDVVTDNSSDVSNHLHAHHAEPVVGTAQAQVPPQVPVQSETRKRDHEGMDHGQMEGMDHSQMEGMEHSQMEGMEHSQMEGMEHSQMEGMEHSQMQGMDHSQMDGMDHSQMEGMEHSQMEGMDHSQLEGMQHGQMEGMDHDKMDMQGGPAPPDARDPDYSDGLTTSHMPGMHHMHGHSVLGSVLVDHLEQFNGQGGSGQAINAQAWYGSDLHKVWFKLEGEREEGQLGSTRMELLWDKALSAYWDFQAGIRHDTGGGPSRNWAAIGVQGLAPYWFEIETTAYFGEQGRTALRLEAEYELLLTQRWVLQPDVELNIYGKDDPARGIGAGLSDLEMGLRLRYEITRKFAPYVGVVWSRKFGKTADYAEEESEQMNDTQLVAGVRFWF